MIEAILNAKTTAEFMEVSSELTSSGGREALFDSISDSGIVLSVDDFAMPEWLERCARSEMAMKIALEKLSTLPIESNLVRRLQLIGVCNPGIKRHIDSFLRRSCV